MCPTGRHSTKGAKGDQSALCPDMAKRCLNGGTPVSSDECACAPGWTGPICGKGENYVSYIFCLQKIILAHCLQ